MGRNTIILSEKYNFSENGGYVVHFTYKPKNFLLKLLILLRLIRFPDPVAEVEDGFKHDYIQIVKTTKFTKNGIFCTTSGTKTVRVLIEEEISKIADLDVKIDKMYS